MDDQEAEAFYDSVYEMLGESVDETLADAIAHWAWTVRKNAYFDGYRQGKAEEQEFYRIKCTNQLSTEKTQ
jgi:hypothetical protein